MSGVIRLKVGKDNLPPGAVLIEDTAALTSGLHDSLARIVQYRLGYVGRGKLPAEAKRLSPVALVAVTKGSGILECQPLDVPGLHGRNPALLAATELIGAINTYSATGKWPIYLPWVVRNRIGAAVATVLDPETSVEISVAGDEGTAACVIDRTVQEALQAPETFSLTEPVHLIGKVFDINVKSRVLKIDAVSKTVTVPFSEEQLEEVDRLRWQRAHITGIPEDDRLKKLASVRQIRAATDDEEDGVVIPSEMSRGEKTEAYKVAATRLEALATLDTNWDSYGGVPPHPATLRFARAFARDVAGVLSDYGVATPVPFVVPTPIGGVQFEWSDEDRELELELPTPNRFQYLRSSYVGEQEGTASRWEAVRLVKWLATGEEP